MNWDLKQIYDKARLLQAKNEVNISNRDNLKNDLNAAKTRKELLEESTVVIQEAAQRTQNKIKNRFETIVQSCIDVIFPNEYKFHFDFIPKRGKTETDIYLEQNGSRLDPLLCNGGGLVDVISIALRVACLTISGKDKVLLLDEPFGHLRGTSREKLGEVLNSLSKKIGLQLVMVGDVGGSSVKADKEFRVSKINGVSKVEEVDLSER